MALLCRYAARPSVLWISGIELVQTDLMSHKLHSFRAYSHRVRRSYNEIAASFLLTLAAVGFLLVAWFGGGNEESKIGNTSSVEHPHPRLR